MRNESVKTMTMCAIMAALMCILGPMSIPIGAVPISFTNLVIYLTVYLLGAKKGCISYLIYMLLGVVGLPVFSGYTGGIAKLAGPTGGYLVGFILLALISGIVLEKTNRNIVWSFVGMVAGTAIAYLFGTVWFVIQAQCTVGYALSVCVMPFIPFDLLKMVIAIALGKVVFIALKRSSLLHIESYIEYWVLKYLKKAQKIIKNVQ